LLAKSLVFRHRPHRDFFACEHCGIEPDLLASSKALGGGRAEIMDTPGIGGLGGTYNGNSRGVRRGAGGTGYGRTRNLCARARHLGDFFLQRASAWQRHWPQIGAIHGLKYCYEEAY